MYNATVQKMLQIAEVTLFKWKMNYQLSQCQKCANLMRSPWNLIKLFEKFISAHWSYGQFTFLTFHLIVWYLNIWSLPGEGAMNNYVLWSFLQSNLYYVVCLVPFTQVVFSFENQE